MCHTLSHKFHSPLWPPFFNFLTFCFNLLHLYLAAIPPSRSKSSVTGTKVTAQLPRTSSSNSASAILEGLPDNLGSFSLKPTEPQHVVYHWGGGITTPTKLQLPQHDSDVAQVCLVNGLFFCFGGFHLFEHTEGLHIAISLILWQRVWSPE